MKTAGPAPTLAPADGDRSRVWLRHRLLWPVVTLLLLLAVNALFNPGFWQLQWRGGHLYGSVVDILNRAAPLALVALGMTLVIATRGIDISVGAVVAIAAAVAALLIGGDLVVKNGVATHASRVPMGVALVAALAVAALCGLWNGLLVARLGLQPIIATLILMVAGRGVAQLLTGGQIITVYHAPYFYLGNGYLLGLPFAVFIAGGVWALLHLAVTRTALGLFIQAIGINPAAARVAGLPQRLITVCCYVCCSVTAGAAGLVISSNVHSADGNNAGLLMELDAILAVTLGGTLLTGGRFSLAGSVLGALIIQTLTSTIYSIGVPPEVNLVVKAAVVFVVMLLQSAEFRATVRGMGAAAGGGPVSAVLPVRTPRIDPRRLPLVGTVAVFLVTAGYGSFAYPGFFSPQVFLNLLIDNAFLCIVAVGMTFVILSGGIDLSVGSVVALTTMISAELVEHRGWSAAATIPLVLVVGTACGASMGFLVQRFRLQPFIVTLAGMFLARGACYLISIDSISITDATYAAISQARLPLGGGASITVGALVALAVVGIGIWLAQGTEFGRTVYAIGGNETSASLMGLPVARTTVLVYTLSGFCSALGGVVLTFYMLSGYGLHAVGLELDAIAAVVIGGTLLSGGVGFVAGTLVGVLILGIVQTLISFDGSLSSWWTRIVIGALLFVFCMLQRVFERQPRRQ